MSYTHFDDGVCNGVYPLCNDYLMICQVEMSLITILGFSHNAWTVKIGEGSGPQGPLRTFSNFDGPVYGLTILYYTIDN